MPDPVPNENKCLTSIKRAKSFKNSTTRKGVKKAYKKL